MLNVDKKYFAYRVSSITESASVLVLLHLFDVEEVLGIKGDACAGHRNVLI